MPSRSAPDLGRYETWISIAQERASVLAFRDSLIYLLRARQEEICWFCQLALPEADNEVDLHHVIPLHIAFPNGHGRPSTIHDLRLVCRACHRRKPRSVG